MEQIGYFTAVTNRMGEIDGTAVTDGETVTDGLYIKNHMSTDYCPNNICTQSV